MQISDFTHLFRTLFCPDGNNPIIFFSQGEKGLHLDRLDDRPAPFPLVIPFTPAWRLSFFVPHFMRDPLRSSSTVGAAELAPIASVLRTVLALFPPCPAVLGKKNGTCTDPI